MGSDTPPALSAPAGSAGRGDLRLPREALLLSRDELARERRDLLVRRLRLLYAAGLGASLVLIGGARLLDPSYDSGPLAVALDVGHVASFALGWLSLRARSPARLEAVALAILAYNALAIPFQPADYPIALGAALLLFVPAAVIPWRPLHQGVLGALVVLGYLAYQLAWYASGAGAEAWATRGGPSDFRTELLTTLVGLAVLAATAFLVTHTLNSLRRSVREARRMGGYLIEGELGRGGMSRVFLARHARMLRPAAIKVLVPQPGEASRNALARFEREVRLAATLTHPNTITIFDYGRGEAGAFYYAMERLEGWDLQNLVDRHGALPAARVAHVLGQVCGALSEAHAAGIVHRDLKPSNLFLTRRGGMHDFVKVLDFGVAKSLRLDTPDPSGRPPSLTISGSLIGTPTYMSPEAATGEGEVGPRSDLYSLGAVAFFLLTGRPPFVGGSAVRLLASHVLDSPPRPSSLTELPIAPALEDLVLRCLAKDPAERPAGASALAAALRAIRFEVPWGEPEAAEWWALHAPPA